MRRLAAMRWTRGMSVTFSSTCERRSITIGRALCEGRRGGRRGRAGSGTVGFVSSDLTKAWLRSGQGLDQVIEFALERLRTIHRRGDLVVHKLAEALAQPVHGDLERPLGHAQRSRRGVGSGAVLGGDEPAREHREPLWVASVGGFHLKTTDGLLDDGECPFVVKERIRRKSPWIGDVDRGMIFGACPAVPRPCVERLDRSTASPFFGQRRSSWSARKCLTAPSRYERNRPRSPLEPLQTVRFKQPGEERVREVPGVVATGTVAPDERFHGAIVCFAQVAKRLPGFRRLAAAREDLGPARCVERICATIVHESTSLFQACTRGLL